jgi:alkylation response protein AidB-like acyl-CoA dehydrogenase
MRGFRGMQLGALMVSIEAITGAEAQTVEIEYWQYVFDARVKAMNELIKRFETANPNIKVKHTKFPYVDYQTKIAAAMDAHAPAHESGLDYVTGRFRGIWLSPFRGHIVSLTGSVRKSAAGNATKLVEDAMDSADIVVDTATRIFSALCDPQMVNKAAGEEWRELAWVALEEAGLTLAWVPAELGGAGATLVEGFAVLRTAGRYALALPLAETLLSGWLLARAGLSSPSGVMAWGPAREGDVVGMSGSGLLSGTLHLLTWAKDAKHLAVVAQGPGGGRVVALVETSSVHVLEGSSLAGDPLNTVSLHGVRPVSFKPAPVGLDEQALIMMGAVVRSMEMAGALEAVLGIAVSYAKERVAFGRPIAKFQAVQQSLARLAGEVAVAIAAAASAADAIASTENFDESVFLEVAAAKIRVGEAVGEGARIAHQVLGAIGFTREHVLHRFTRRLWAWRDDCGTESMWAIRLGRLVAGKGADDLWPLLAAQ